MIEVIRKKSNFFVRTISHAVTPKRTPENPMLQGSSGFNLCIPASIITLRASMNKISPKNFFGPISCSTRVSA